MKDLFFEIKEKEYGISPLPKNPTVTMAYIPYQNANKMYNLEQGLCSGTIFPDLDRPFNPNYCSCRGENS